MHNWKIWRIFGILLCAALRQSSRTFDKKMWSPTFLCSAPQVISKKSWIFLMKINFSKLLNYNAIFFHNSNKLWIYHKDKEDLIVVCHSITMLWKKNSKRCILPVLRQKSTQKSQSSNAEEPAQNALVIQLQNYPKNIRRKYLLRWNLFFFASTHITLTKLFLLSKEQKKKYDCASKISNGSIRISVCNSLPNVKDVNKSVER